MDARHILLAEDEPGIRRALARALESRGHRVTVAATAHEAIAALIAQSFDVLVLDINLPDATGWTVLQWIDVHQLPTLPVIVMSAVAPSAARVREFHPMGVLTKPFPVESLYRMVDGVSSLVLERMVNE